MVLRAFFELPPREPPPPAGPFLPSPPRGVALWPYFQRFPGSGTAVFANFPGKGGGAPSSGGRTAPSSLRGRARAWKGRPARRSPCGCKCVDPRRIAARGPGLHWLTVQQGPCNIPKWVEGRWARLQKGRKGKNVGALCPATPVQEA